MAHRKGFKAIQSVAENNGKSIEEVRKDIQEAIDEAWECNDIPAVWNTGVVVTEKNREKVYFIIRTLLSILTFAISVLFSCTAFCSAQGKTSL